MFYEDNNQIISPNYIFYIWFRIKKMNEEFSESFLCTVVAIHTVPLKDNLNAKISSKVPEKIIDVLNPCLLDND